MSEASTVEHTPQPRTRENLAADLFRLGIKPGVVVLVHSSLSSLGWVNGGPTTVIQALMDLLTPEGTLIMPAHSGDYSDPGGWQNPPVPQAWHQIIRDTMPAFDRARTPTRGMGRIAELFRTWPEVYRSAHPQVSFAAWGKHALRVTTGHSINDSLGEASPLAGVYALDGRVLLMGVGYETNTSFHLAEYRAGRNKQIACGAPILRNGHRVWCTYTDIEFADHLFAHLGADFESTGCVVLGHVGSATCRLFSQRSAVDFALGWLQQRAEVGDDAVLDSDCQ